MGLVLRIALTPLRLTLDLLLGRDTGCTYNGGIT